MLRILLERPMVILGLPSTGKTTALAALSVHGIPVVDTDWFLSRMVSHFAEREKATMHKHVDLLDILASMIAGPVALAMKAVLFSNLQITAYPFVRRGQSVLYFYRSREDLIDKTGISAEMAKDWMTGVYKFITQPFITGVKLHPNEYILDALPDWAFHQRVDLKHVVEEAESKALMFANSPLFHHGADRGEIATILQTNISTLVPFTGTVKDLLSNTPKIKSESQKKGRE